MGTRCTSFTTTVRHQMPANSQTADEGESVPLSGNMSLVKVVLHSLLEDMKLALLRCAETLQYEASVLPAMQMGQTVLPEKFSKKQQAQSRLDGGLELDGTSRQLLETTEEEPPGHRVLEQRRAAAERVPPVSFYSQVSLQGCHQSLMPVYRLPWSTCNITPVDDVGMSAHAANTACADRPVW